MAPKALLHTLPPILLNLMTLVLCCLVIFSGFNNSLTQIHWLKTDNTAISLPSPLSSSGPLEDLSALTGTDYTGSPTTTASSLSLPDFTTIHLLTECSLFPASTSCSAPDLNFWFRPERDLKISATSRSGRDSVVFKDALRSYARSARFVEWSFLIAAFCALGAPVESYFSPLLASVTCGFGMVFLGAGTITAAVVFKRLSDAINGEFGDVGIKCQNGGVPVALGMVGALMLAGACGGYVLVYRKQKGKKGWGGVEGGRGVGQEGEAGVPLVGGGMFGGGQQHGYAQVEKLNGGGQQQQQQQQGVVGDRDLERRMEDDWAAPDEYSGRGNGGNAKGSNKVPLVSMGAGGNNRQTRDLNTGYEPYSRQF
ncbi:hypothetical protein QBC41DRAFT_235780 [Cercophora samala]|uniref:Integral membrane protein n=1 Tax=Cercophora samala TaxID=330535 RepID=A0AA39YZX3_9PEZI|nr:hypothetical protein QBC41DRAFT_235780 [Cercophora samala]